MINENKNIKLEDLQKYLTNNFKEIIEILERNNLKYFVAGGTLLGTIRHNGFIPWDDDIDIHMPREDYDRLLKSAKKILPDYYEVSNINLDIRDSHFYSKIIDKRTTLITDSFKRITSGVFIDIFPLDNAGDDLHEAEKTAIKIRKNVNKFAIITGRFKKTRFRKVIFILSSWIFKLLLNNKKIIKKIDKENSKYRDNNSRYIAAFYGEWIQKDIFERIWFQEYEKMRFSDFTVRVPKMYDDILKKMYGDYMRLPSKEKQVSNHDFIYLDLKKSFLDFK